VVQACEWGVGHRGASSALDQDPVQREAEDCGHGSPDSHQHPPEPERGGVQLCMDQVSVGERGTQGHAGILVTANPFTDQAAGLCLAQLWGPRAPSAALSHRLS
jgi:hypothetical protein